MTDDPLDRPSAGSPLTEKEAIGHFAHWLMTARDACRIAPFDIRGPLRVVPALRNAAEATRAIAFLRSDLAWLGYGRLIQQMIDNRPEGWAPGNLKWFELAGKLDAVRHAVEKKYLARVTVGV